MKKLLPILIFVVFAMPAIAQYPSRIEVPSALFLHKNTYNPAFAGFDDRHVMDMSFRLGSTAITLVDIRGNYEGIYKSHRFGFFGNAFSDNKNEYKFCPMYNYRFSINAKSFLAVGVQFNYIYSYLSNSVPTLLPVEPPYEYHYVSGDLGILYGLSNFHAGITARNMIANFDYRYYTFLTSYRFDVKNFSITPAFVVHYLPNETFLRWQTQFHSEVSYNNLLYLSFSITENLENLGGALGIRLRNLAQFSVYHNAGWLKSTGLTMKIFLSGK